jgi:hypothetical protein
MFHIKLIIIFVFLSYIIYDDMIEFSLVYFFLFKILINNFLIKSYFIFFTTPLLCICLIEFQKIKFL